VRHRPVESVIRYVYQAFGAFEHRIATCARLSQDRLYPSQVVFSTKVSLTVCGTAVFTLTAVTLQ
jgi:hypothetical protein